MKKYLFFDFDGTLVNTKKGIVKSVYYALDAIGAHEDEPEKLERFIGPPLHESFKDFYQLNDNAVQRAIEKFRERYTEKGIFESKPYDGVMEMLSAAKEGGRTICIASSKPQPHIERLLEHFNMTGIFDVVVGASLDGSLIYKADIIRKLMSLLPDAAAEEMIMIGDRRQDVLGAKECGIDSIGVKYGFAEQGELEEAGATYIAQDMNALTALLQSI